MNFRSMLFIALIISILINSMIGSCEKPSPIVTKKPDPGDTGKGQVSKGGGGEPPGDLCVYIIANTSTAYRGGTILVDYSVKATNKKIKDIKIEFDIPICFGNIKQISESDEYQLYRNKIIFKKNSMSEYSCSNCTYNVQIPLNSECDTYDLNKTIHYWDWDHKNALIRNSTTISKIEIINNPPAMLYAEVCPISGVAHFIPHLGSNSLIWIGNINPVELTLRGTASDKEDGNLTYIWRINNSNTSISIIPTYKSEILYTWENLRPGNYSFHVLVVDPTLEKSNETLANITYNGEHYTHIIIPSNSQKIPLIMYSLIMLMILFIGIIKNHVTRIAIRDSEIGIKFITKYFPFFKTIYANILILLIILLTITYIYYTIYISYGAPINKIVNMIYGENPYPLPIEIILYSRSLNLFEIYIYIIVFLVVVYITEMIFGYHDILQSERYISSKPKWLPLPIAKIAYSTTTTSTLWFVNSLLMLIMLLSLDSIIYRVEPSFAGSWLRNYYSVMAEIFATILAIVAAFYTTVPKNVITTKEQLMFSVKDIKDPIGLAVILKNARDSKEDPLSNYIKRRLHPDTIDTSKPKNVIRKNLANDLNKIIRNDNLLNNVELDKSTRKLISQKSKVNPIYANRRLLEMSYQKHLERDIIEYKHPRILHNFIIFYSIVVVICIWGFSAGVTTRFDPIVIFKPETTYNLITIAIFETSLLLAPPAITWLYELLRSILFTGTIKLDSIPDCAKIIVDGYDTGLRTPNKLMLPDGRHTILLRKEGYDDHEVGCIKVITGTEQGYSCHMKSE